MLLRPSSLARYMAMSAFLISVCASVPSRGKMLTPMLAVSTNSWPRTITGSSTAVEQLAGQRGERVALDHVLGDHHELVAAQPGQDVGGAQPVAQAPRHDLQHLVADVVAQRVVDGLEAVEVDEQHAQRRRRCARRGSWRATGGC